MKYSGIIIITLLLTGVLHAQEFRFTINELDTEKAVLYSVEGEKTEPVDTVYSSSGDTYAFDLSRGHKGMYRLVFDVMQRIDFLNTGEPVTVLSNIENLRENLRNVEAEQNRYFFRFAELNRMYKIKRDLLIEILRRYPDRKDDYYRITAEKLSGLKDEYLAFIDEVNEAIPGTYAARYINSARLPVPPDTLDEFSRNEWIRIHALDYVDFDDTGLIYSDIFTNKTIEYLSYYRDPRLTKDKLSELFTEATDNLLARAKVNPLVYKQVTEYLIEGFQQFGFENVVDYIIKNYVIEDDICVNEEDTSLKRMADQEKYLFPGAEAPEFFIPDSAGETVRLSDIDGKKLLVFYSIWCPHCMDMIPELKKLYESNGSFEVIAVSLDSETEEWKNKIKELGLDWINLVDTEGWDAPSARAYHIYATPTMFLLDRENRIIAKPKDINELKQAL